MVAHTWAQQELVLAPVLHLPCTLKSFFFSLTIFEKNFNSCFIQDSPYLGPHMNILILCRPWPVNPTVCLITGKCAGTNATRTVCSHVLLYLEANLGRVTILTGSHIFILGTLHPGQIPFQLCGAICWSKIYPDNQSGKLRTLGFYLFYDMGHVGAGLVIL